MGRVEAVNVTLFAVAKVLPRALSSEGAPVLVLAQNRSNPLVVSIEGDGFQARISAGEQRDRISPDRAA